MSEVRYVSHACKKKPPSLLTEHLCQFVHFFHGFFFLPSLIPPHSPLSPLAVFFFFF